MFSLNQEALKKEWAVLFCQYFSSLLGLGFVAEPGAGLHKPPRPLFFYPGVFRCRLDILFARGKTHLIYNE